MTRRRVRVVEHPLRVHGRASGKPSTGERFDICSICTVRRDEWEWSQAKTAHKRPGWRR